MKDFSWVGWLLVVAGWWIVNRTNNQRETRKEARSAADQAKKDVQAIAKNAIAYFGDVTSPLADDIKNALELLEVELERVVGYKTSNLAVRFQEFHDRCTGADFEAATRVVHGPASAAVQGVLFTRNRLIGELERHYRNHYVNTTWRGTPKSTGQD